MSSPVNGDHRVWINRSEACSLLGVGKDRLANMADQGRVSFRTVGKYRQYDRVEIEAIKAEAKQPVAEFHDDGSESINLNGRVADWSCDSFIARVDACWIFLTAHGYMHKIESEAIRGRILADIERSKSRRKFRCMAAPTMRPFYNGHNGRDE